MLDLRDSPNPRNMISHFFCLQHRPDLFRALQRTPSMRLRAENGTSDGIMNENGKSRSNPFQFLYGGMFVRKNKESLPSVSLASRDSESMEPPVFNDSAPTWWQKLAQSLNGQTLACDEDPSQYEFAFSVSLSRQYRGFRIGLHLLTCYCALGLPSSRRHSLPNLF